MESAVAMEKFEPSPVGDILTRAAEQVPDKIAVVDGDRRTSYRQLDDAALSLAAALADLGLRKGDRAAIYMPNSLELMTAFYALQKLGIWAVWANPLYRESEARFIFENSCARGVFVFAEWDGHDYLAGLLAMKKDLPDLELIVAAGGGTVEGVHRMGDLVAEGRGRKCPAAGIDVYADISMLLYTSGTTGKPKGAMIGHYAAARAGWEYAQGVKAGTDDVFIGFLPMSHSYGCGAILIQPVLLQSTVVLMDKFDVNSAFRLIERERVTLQLAAPTHYILELNHPERAHYDLSSLRAGMIAGQIAPEGLISRAEREMGIYLTSFWGASEVGPGLGTMCPFPSPLETRERFVGLPVADTRVRIVDSLTRQALPPGQIGELTLSGWHVMKGYWRDPEETRRQIIDGWLHMGDLAACGEDGYIRIFGRSKDLINRGGYKIYPFELEALMIEHPKIDQACVVATPNPVLGESICACVIPSTGQSVGLGELRDFLRDRIAPHKLPDELCVMPDFPRLSGGVKIRKFGPGGLAELAAADANRERKHPGS